MAGRTYRRRFLLLGGVCLLLLLGSMLVGRYGLSAGKLLHMLWTRLTGGAADWSVSDEKVVFAIRLPRIAAAALVGAALAVSGTAYQGMFRNPMVSPDILGASTGAGFGAALAILLGAGYFGISLAAFCFGLLAVAAAWLVSRLSRSDPTVALILAGMMISSLFPPGRPLSSWWRIPSSSCPPSPIGSWAASAPSRSRTCAFWCCRWRWDCCRCFSCAGG